MRLHNWGAATMVAALLVAATSASAKLIDAGKAAPAWSSKTTKAKPISSSQYKGKVVLMNFFSYT